MLLYLIALCFYLHFTQHHNFSGSFQQISLNLLSVRQRSRNQLEHLTFVVHSKTCLNFFLQK